jgi:hypothetical protein
VKQLKGFKLRLCVGTARVCSASHGPPAPHEIDHVAAEAAIDKRFSKDQGASEFCPVDFAFRVMGPIRVSRKLGTFLTS